jgi:hypothetical protein
VQSGAASLSVSTLSVGAHSITAVYSGDGAAYLGSTSAGFTETVGKAATTATLAASPNPATAGQSVTLSAAVSPAGATGTRAVPRWRDCPRHSPGEQRCGDARYFHTLRRQPFAHRCLRGDATNSGSTSAVFTETVNKAATSVTLAASPNPATTGQSVTLSAQSHQPPPPAPCNSLMARLFSAQFRWAMAQRHSPHPRSPAGSIRSPPPTRATPRIHRALRR